jgi:predicted metalloprotease with PDZ domain
MGIRGDEESDWIVEGFAEFYSVETLRRSGGVGQGRYDEAMNKLRRWAKRAPTLFVDQSNGATTARAVLALQAADVEIRKLTNGTKSLDDVARELAAKRGRVSLERLQEIATHVAGKPLHSLEREQLMKPVSGPEP